MSTREPRPAEAGSGTGQSPFILAVERNGAVREHVAGFRLAWLIASTSLPAESHEVTLARRTAFARYVSNLGPEVTVEFRFVAQPRTGSGNRSVALTVFLCRAAAQAVDITAASMTPAAIGFLSALRAHFPEAEFVPFTSGDDLSGTFSRLSAGCVWKFGHAMLEVPIAGGMPRPSVSIGFGEKQAMVGIEDRPPAATFDLVIPWVPSVSDWRRVAEALYWADEPLVLQIAARPAPLAGSRAESEILEALRQCDELPDSNESGLTKSVDIEMIRRRIVERRNALFASSLLLSVTLRGDGEVARETAALIAGELSGQPWTSSGPWDAGAGAVRFGRLSHGATEEEPDPGTDASLCDLFTADEAAGALRFPSSPLSHLDGLPIRRFRTGGAPAGSWGPGAGSLFLGHNVHRGVEAAIHLSALERRRHVYIAGKTGTGKSTLLERMILGDIRAGLGLAVFDPHGDLVENILSRMAPERAADVVLFDFAESERPIAFNPLVWSTLPERDFVIEEFIAAILARLPADQVGPIFETYARNFLKLLMGDAPRTGFTPSFADFPLLFQRDGFRKMLVNSISDESVIDFVREAESNTSNEMRLSSMAGYITSKFSRFIGSNAVIRTVGQPGNAIDFRQAMDEGRIILVNLAKGRVGQMSAEILCSLLIARFRAAAMGRANVPIEKRRDFTLYVDEFQNVASSSYSELLSEARKYRLSLVLANQYIAQLPEHVTQAILGNVGCIFSFRVGVNDAKVLADVFEPAFGARDIVELPVLHAYVSCLVGGEVSRPFSVRCSREWPAKDLGQAQAIREMSRTRWGTDSQEVDEILRRRRAYINELD